MRTMNPGQGVRGALRTTIIKEAQGTWLGWKVAHLVGLVTDPTAEGLTPDMGDHVPLQHGGGTEDLPACGAGMILLGVHLMDVFAVVL